MATQLTGLQTTTEEIKREAASHFFSDFEKCKFEATSGGVNNVVQYITDSKGNKYVLRIYNNGFNTKRVNFEHEVLESLQAHKLSFKVPVFLKNLRDGRSHMPLANGAESCVCELIPGALPKTKGARQIGEASGELCSTLAKLPVMKSPCPTPPYYDLYAVHHAMSREKFLQEMQTEQFAGVRQWADVLVKEILEIDDLVNGEYQRRDLPRQLIHGDLHYDNILCDDSGVTGLLDFEFAAYDWRAMELAICLSKYAGEANALEIFTDFVDGFGVKGVLTRPEVEAIPDLIILRVLSNVVYFVGRAVAGEDSMDSLIKRAETYSKRVAWLKSNRGVIVDLIDARMSKNY